MAGETKTAGDWRKAACFVAAGVLAAAGLATTPSTAHAQFRSDNDGRALDANKRVGSGGRNDGPGNGGYNSNGPMVTGNQIITGNVTGGRQFRGPVPYSDPNSFRGPTGSFNSDRFVRSSAGVPRPYGATDVDPSQPTAFYGSGRVTPLPSGFVPTVGATGGYVPTNSAVNQPNFDASRSYTPMLDPTLRSRELIMPSPDRANQDSMLSASPLYGVRVWRAGEMPNDFTAGQRETGTDWGDRFGGDANSVARMRDEVNRAGLGNTDQRGAQNNTRRGPDNEATEPGGAGQGVDNTTGGTPGLSRPLGGSIGGPASQQPNGVGTVGTNAMQSALGTTALQGSTATGQSIRANLLVPPERQTPQLARLRQAFERQQRGSNVSDVEAARQFNLELQASRRPAAGTPAQQGAQPGQPGAPGGQNPGAAPGAGGLPPTPRDVKIPPAPSGQSPATAPGAAPSTPAAPGGVPPAPTPAEPQKVGSIAEGVEAKGLHDVLASAEDLMKQQKFTDAVDEYAVAQRVAPNNPLILMGRANAELAGSYYRRAETSLREAVARAPELTVAQFDLRSLVGEDRLQVLVKDLKELGQDPKQVRAPLLLAYIAYNTGNEAQAGEYLAAAEKVAGADDALLKAWRRGWKLPGATTEPAAAPAPRPAPVSDNK